MKSEHAKLAEEMSRLIAANKLLTERIAKLEQSASASSSPAVTWSSIVDASDHLFDGPLTRFSRSRLLEVEYLKNGAFMDKFSIEH